MHRKSCQCCWAELQADMWHLCYMVLPATSFHLLAITHERLALSPMGPLPTGAATRTKYSKKKKKKKRHPARLQTPSNVSVGTHKKLEVPPAGMSFLTQIFPLRTHNYQQLHIWYWRSQTKQMWRPRINNQEMNGSSINLRRSASFLECARVGSSVFAGTDAPENKKHVHSL